jgi:hypothetical protein
LEVHRHVVGFEAELGQSGAAVCFSTAESDTRDGSVGDDAQGS